MDSPLFVVWRARKTSPELTDQTLLAFEASRRFPAEVRKFFDGLLFAQAWQSRSSLNPKL
jgi:hypothetical protein